MIYLSKRHESGRLLGCQNPACQKLSNLNIQRMAHTFKAFHSESFLVKCSRFKNLPKLFDLHVFSLIEIKGLRIEPGLFRLPVRGPLHEQHIAIGLRCRRPLRCP